MLVSRHPCRTKRRGAHLVEFALVAPVFFVFVLGIIDIGRGLMVSSLLSNAARAGCRVGVLPGKSDSDVQAAVAQALNRQGISGTTTSVRVNGTAANANTAQAKDLITVTITVPVTNVAWLPMTAFVKGTLSGQFSLEHE
jgi:Flp pilus assembly protein TadG